MAEIAQLAQVCLAKERGDCASNDCEWRETDGKEGCDVNGLRSLQILSQTQTGCEGGGQPKGW